MIRAFLIRFFPQFVALEADLVAARVECQRLQQENLRLQDRLDAAVEDRGRQWSLLESSIREMAISYQAHVNVQWQQRGFGAPYPEAPHIPPNAAPQPVPDPVVPRRELPSERQARLTNEFARTVADRFLKQ